VLALRFFRFSEVNALWSLEVIYSNFSGRPASHEPVLVCLDSPSSFNYILIHHIAVVLRAIEKFKSKTRP
jgi:hypothetical protein